MRKYMFLGIILIIMLLISLKNEDKIEIKNLNQKLDFKINTFKTNSIYSINLKILGNITGDAILYLKTDDNKIYKKIDLKSGKINFKINNLDWYNYDALLEYEPKSVNITGNLVIYYKFNTL